MTRHDPLVRLRHMQDHAREAVEMSLGRTRRDLEIEVIGFLWGDRQP